eukprot:747490-Hanusia_phi.AAC.4
MSRFSSDLVKRDILARLPRQEGVVSTSNVVLADSAEQLMLLLLQVLVGPEQQVGRLDGSCAAAGQLGWRVRRATWISSRSPRFLRIVHVFAEVLQIARLLEPSVSVLVLNSPCSVTGSSSSSSTTTTTSSPSSSGAGQNVGARYPRALQRGNARAAVRISQLVTAEGRLGLDGQVERTRAGEVLRAGRVSGS